MRAFHQESCITHARRKIKKYTLKYKHNESMNVFFNKSTSPDEKRYFSRDDMDEI